MLLRRLVRPVQGAANSKKKMKRITLYPTLLEAIRKAESSPLSDRRKIILKPLIDYIRSKREAEEEINLNFICTHNSRRSQFAQIWAKTSAACFGVEINTYSGGVEVTAFNERAVKSLRRSGFRIDANGVENPVYSVYYADDAEPIRAFSKLFDHEANRAEKFAAIMTCSDADENCPYIPGTEKRIAVNYEDPKVFDDTLQEEMKYDERSVQIASEMLYVFAQVAR